jgi:hypothetical protein
MGQTKNPDELSPVEAAQLLAKSVVSQIDKHLAELKSELSKMQKREAEGAALAKKSRSVFDLVKSEDLIDSRHSNDPEKRIKTFKSPRTVGPLDKAPKVIEAEGSGGDIKKAAMPAVPSVKAGPSAPSAKPTGVPSAPKPPQAPGAAPTMHKMDIPSSAEKANGGPQPTKKMEIPASAEKANGGPQPTKKMELPTTPEKANGGPMAKMALSPVFAVRPRMGGKDPVSQQMTADASHASHQAAQQQNTMALPKTKLPSVAEHASRANYMADFAAKGGHAAAPTRNAGGIDLPPDDGTVPEIHTGASQFGLAPAGKFGKSEMDSMKCPKCKKGMTACKCYNGSKGK